MSNNSSSTAVRNHSRWQWCPQLAMFVTVLQHMNAAGGPPPGEHNAWRGAPLAMRDGAVRSAIASLSAAINTKAATAVWDAALSAPVWNGAPIWIHGDLDSRNLLVRDGRLTAVLDFGCLGVGDPACDVMVAWKVFSGRSRETFLTTLSIDEAMCARARGWVLSQAILALDYYTIRSKRRHKLFERCRKKLGLRDRGQGHVGFIIGERDFEPRVRHRSECATVCLAPLSPFAPRK